MFQRKVTIKRIPKSPFITEIETIKEILNKLLDNAKAFPGFMSSTNTKSKDGLYSTIVYNWESKQAAMDFKNANAELYTQLNDEFAKTMKPNKKIKMTVSDDVHSITTEENES